MVVTGHPVSMSTEIGPIPMASPCRIGIDTGYSGSRSAACSGPRRERSGPGVRIGSCRPEDPEGIGHVVGRADRPLSHDPVRRPTSLGGAGVGRHRLLDSRAEVGGSCWRPGCGTDRCRRSPCRPRRRGGGRHQPRAARHASHIVLRTRRNHLPFPHCCTAETAPRLPCARGLRSARSSYATTPSGAVRQ